MKKYLQKVVILLLSVGVIGSVSICDAAEESIRSEIAELKARIAQLEKRLEEQEEVVKETKEHLIRYRPGEGVEIEGLKIGASGTFVGQGTVNANNAGTGPGSRDSIFDGSYSIDLEIEKEFEGYGMAFLHLEGGQGDTVEGELSLFSNVNRDAGDSGNNVQITEFWYEHYLFDKQISLMAGKCDATVMLDTNEFANDECTKFLGHMFRNSDTIEFPDDNGLGARLLVAPKALEFIELEGGWFEADADWEDVADHAFVYTQINVKPRILDQEGNYRFYFWFNDKDHAEFVKEGEVQEEFKEPNYGLGISFDQALLDYFGLFARFGWQYPKVSNLEWAWSTGGELKGNLWNRDDDVLALAVGQAIPGEEYNDAGNPAKIETHLESYYNVHINDHLTIGPDLQVIWRPNGVGCDDDGDPDTIVVYGIRGQIDF